MKVGRWSTAAGSNNAATPDGWPEGQLPSTVNDCAREMMAAIRVALLDPQFIDQDLSPTFITALSFSVPGNQTSAIHIGRRLKIFDATAGVQQIIYATVQSVSFTSVTTVHIETDSGSLTSSLSSFGMSIISNINNALPRDSDLTISSLAVAGNMSISGAAALNGAVQMGNTLSCSGQASFNSGISVSATATAAIFVGANTPKAYVKFELTAGGAGVYANYNIESVTRSAAGVVRVNFSTDMATAFYTIGSTIEGSALVNSMSETAASCKFTLRTTAGVATDNIVVHMVFYHP